MIKKLSIIQETSDGTLLNAVDTNGLDHLVVRINKDGVTVFSVEKDSYKPLSILCYDSLKDFGPDPDGANLFNQFNYDFGFMEGNGSKQLSEKLQEKLEANTFKKANA